MANHFKLHTDNPIKNSEYDGLGFEEYSNVLSKVILNTDTPFTIGIFGEWGKGKTSLMHLVKDKIDKSNNNKSKFITVFFNAWQYENDTDPIIALIVAINDAIESKKLIDDKIWEGMKDKLGDIATFTKYAMCVFNEVKFKAGGDDLGIELGLDLAKPFEKFQEAMEEKESEINKLINKNRYFQIFKVLEELEKKLENENIEIVVFIDDLDRCLPNNAVRLLESIKLVLDLKGFTFVLGVAREVIEGHLEYKYEEEFGIKTGNHGKFYLDKIIQLPFYLPNHSSKMEDISNALYKKLGKDIKIEKPLLEVLECISLLDVVTPRFLVRLINRIKVSIEIIKEKEKKDEHQKYLEIFSVSCTLEELYKKEYILLSKSSEKINYISKKLNNSSEIKEESNSLNELLLKDDGVIKNILQTKAGNKWLSEENNRKMSFEFLKSSSEEDYLHIEKEIEYKTIEELRTNLIELDEKVKTVEDFKKYITKNKNISYDTFVKVKNKEGAEFEYSKYLVTNFWYKKFIDANGYDKKEYWSDEGWEFIKEEKITLPKYWEDEEFNGNFQPVVGVSYYEAEAFANYLSKTKDGIYSLPTKDEFEYVTSGGVDKAGKIENRKYPWGNEYSNLKCNNYDIGLQKTSIVGTLASGDSKDTISDMSGNVWKWTKSKIDNKNYYIIGGSWFGNDEAIFRVSSSIDYQPNNRNFDLGFHLTRTKGNTL